MNKIDEQSVKRTHELVSLLLERLQDDLTKGRCLNDEDWDNFWGQKENAVSVLGKLSQILLKLIALPDDSGGGGGDISKEDAKVLEDYHARLVAAQHEEEKDYRSAKTIGDILRRLQKNREGGYCSAA